MLIADQEAASPALHDLLRQAQAGDVEAFSRMVGPMEGRLFRQAIALCQDVETSEDLVVETLAEAWCSLGRFQGRCRFSTWLYSILLHRHWKAQRRAVRQPVAWSRLPLAEAERRQQAAEGRPTEEVSPSRAALDAELGEALRQAVAELPQKQRQVILLRFFEGASLADIAEVAGCSVGTVKSRIHHALEKLRQRQGVLNLFSLMRDT